MASRGITRALERLHQGGSFEEFERVTRRDWERIAHYLCRRWALPAGVEPEDLRQELLIASWLAVGQWDETRGTPLRRFVVWQSVTAAKHWLHKQRAAGHDGDHAESRHPVTFTEIGTEPVEVCEPTQVETAAARETIRKFFATAKGEERTCLLAVLDAGTVTQAVDRLFETGVYRKRVTARRAMRRMMNGLSDANREVSQWLQ